MKKPGGPVVSTVKLVWEIPASVLSFLFYKSFRLALQVLLALRFLRKGVGPPAWRLLSADLLEQERLALPRIMTTGPRWNTHALVAVLGPLGVRATIGIEVGRAAAAANLWTLVVYKFPGAKTVASVGSVDAPFENPWKTLRLEAGRYMIFLRYYGWSQDAELPAVEIDGGEAASRLGVPPGVNDFYHGLKQRKNPFYLLLAYYVFTILRFRKWLPRSFVERELLPVGNPESRFCYGPLAAGESLLIEIDAKLLANANVYFTLYDRASFPAAWYQIEEERHSTAQCAEDGFYLLRIHDKVADPDPPSGDPVHVTVRR